MRILRVAQQLYPEVPGGGPYHVHALSRDQAAMGHDVTVLTVSDDPAKPRHEVRDGYRVVRRSSTLELLGNDISAGVAAVLYGASGYDVLHAHSHMYFSTNLAALKRWFSDTPLAITNHSLYSQSASKTMFDAYLHSIGRWTLNRADVVFCYTDEERDSARELGVETELAVVPNGVDTTRFSPENSEHEPFDDGLDVLFAGRLVEGKRPKDAIKAIAKARKSHPRMTLSIAGDGPLRPELERFVSEQGMEAAIEFLGHVAYEEMPSLYHSADVLVLPSRAEGLPRAVLESLSTGTPVVTSDLSQLRSIVEGAGITVPVGDSEGFADALSALADDDERYARYSARGRERVETDHSWAETVRLTTQRLESL